MCTVVDHAGQHSGENHGDQHARRNVQTSTTLARTPAETTTPPLQPTSTATGTAAEALCTAADLAGSLDSTGGGGAGQIYFRLIVRNTSATTCTLDGYPGVFMVLGPTGDALGASADRAASLPSRGPITLAPEGTAEAQLRYTQAGNYPDCSQVAANGFRVYRPSATDSPYIDRPTAACSNTDIKLLAIGAFQP